MMHWLRFTLATALLLAASAATAACHLFLIEQIYSNASGTVQFIVMGGAGINGENLWKGSTLTSTHAGVTKSFEFPNDIPGNTAGHKVLIATEGFAALNLVKPDFTIPNGFLATDNGTIQYSCRPDQVTYTSLPTNGTSAITRTGQTIPNVATNFAGASASVPATPAQTTPDLNQHGLTGSWYEPATSGQGIELEFYPNLVSAGTALVQGAWFTFDASTVGGVERQRWYTFSGNAQSGSPNVPVTIYRNVDGNFNALPVTQAVAVGTGTLAFAQCDKGTLDYTFSDGSGRTGTIDLTRLLPNVTCKVGAAPTTSADYALSGNWYDPATSGQGFLIDVNPVAPYFFLTWYTYAPAGQGAGAASQRWFTAQVAYVAGSRSVTAKLFETTGGLFDRVTNPAPATVEVGTATATFLSCSSARLQYVFTSGGNAGMAGTITLSRVGPVPPGCV